jgi:NADH-quinone oxidoreductase subunit G
VVRLRPRPNEAVNHYYLCETGRASYRQFNRRDRLDQPQLRQQGALQVGEWDQAIETAARLIDGRRLVVLASPNLSNESLFLLERLLARNPGQGVFRVERGASAPLPGVADLALREERAANATGARVLGFTETATIDGFLQPDDVLLLVGDDGEGLDPSLFSRAHAVISVSTVLSAPVAAAVAVALPTTTTLEEEGTFTNLRGRVQRFLQAKTAPGIARPTWFVLADLLAAAGGDARFFVPGEVFAALAATHPAFAGLDYESMGLLGLPMMADATAVAPAEVPA